MRNLDKTVQTFLHYILLCERLNATLRLRLFGSLSPSAVG